MAKTSFGEHLKREREMRGVSLQEISTATRISTRFLDALETEQWDRLPGGVFNRGFVRAVAHFLGLDEESLLAEYSMATNDHPQVAVWADKAPPPKPKSTWKHWAAFVLLLTAAGTMGWSLMKHPELFEVPVVYAPSTNPGAASQPVAPPAATHEQAPPLASSPATASTGNPPASPGEALELKIDVGRETTLTVIADGKRVFNGKVAAGDQQRFRANQKFEVAAGDSHAVLLELNGLTLPPLGPPGQPGRMSLTHDDLKKLRGGQN